MNAVLKMKSALERAARQVMEFKVIEDDAKVRRLEAEEQILQLMEGKTEGTVHEEDGGLKVTVTYKVTRTVDSAKVAEDWNEIPELVKEAFTWKPDLVLKHMRALETANAEAYAVLAKYITTKPAKPSISIKEVA